MSTTHSAGVNHPQNKESLDEKIINNWSASIGTHGRIHPEYSGTKATNYF